MLALRWGRVLEVGPERPGAQEIACDLGPAVCYPQLTGRAAKGDRVLLNTIALERDLGTGGFHLVAAVAGREPGPGAAPGAHVKLRYTPWQFPVQAAEESSPLPEGLSGMPVIAGSLHSQLGPAAAGFKHAAPAARLAYVMTDGGALPVWLSRQVAALRDLGLIDAVITAGQAFGGDLEAVALPSALLLACGAARCQAAIACMGPGISGTGSEWGHTGIEQAWIVEAAAVLGGRPIACARLSLSDPRPRHRGLSHHAATALGRLASAAALVPWPADGDAALLSPLAERHALVRVQAGSALSAARRLLPRHESMGRGWDAEWPLFSAAVAAGVLAGLLVR